LKKQAILCQKKGIWGYERGGECLCACKGQVTGG